MVIEAIQTRRTVREFTDEPVSDALLETIIEAATWAPNNRQTEPWRFVVLKKNGKMRSQVAEKIHDWTYTNVKNPTPTRRKNSSAAVKQEILEVLSELSAYRVIRSN